MELRQTLSSTSNFWTTDRKDVQVSPESRTSLVFFLTYLFGRLQSHCLASRPCSAAREWTGTSGRSVRGSSPPSPRPRWDWLRRSGTRRSRSLPGTLQQEATFSQESMIVKTSSTIPVSSVGFCSSSARLRLRLESRQLQDWTWKGRQTIKWRIKAQKL